VLFDVVDVVAELLGGSRKHPRASGAGFTGRD